MYIPRIVVLQLFRNVIPPAPYATVISLYYFCHWKHSLQTLISPRSAVDAGSNQKTGKEQENKNSMKLNIEILHTKKLLNFQTRTLKLLTNEKLSTQTKTIEATLKISSAQ